MFKTNLLWLIALLGGAMTLAGCPSLLGDDDDSASDDDDSAADDDDSASDDDDSAAGTTCGSLNDAFGACATVGGWDAGDVDFCALEDAIDEADRDAFIGCAEDALLALDCSSVASADEATAALEGLMRANPGCEQFAPAPEAMLESIEVGCTDLPLANEDPFNGGSGQHSTWNIDLHIEPGRISSDGLELYMWDGNAGHYVDPHQPFIEWENTATDDNDAFDDWAIEISGWVTIGETSTAQNDTSTPEATLLKCRDTNEVPQIENRDFMVCASDFNYVDLSACWFCGNFYGESATTETVGTLGGQDATDIFDDATSAKYPCFYTDET